MKPLIIIVSALTTFAIVAGGAYGAVMFALEGQVINNRALVACLVLGLVAAMKDVRAVMSLPPLSNGNYDAIAQMLKMGTANEKPNETDPPGAKSENEKKYPESGAAGPGFTRGQ